MNPMTSPFFTRGPEFDSRINFFPDFVITSYAEVLNAGFSIISGTRRLARSKVSFGKWGNSSNFFPIKSFGWNSSIRSTDGDTSTALPFLSIIKIRSETLPNMRRYRSSLSRSACSISFRSVISRPIITIPEITPCSKIGVVIASKIFFSPFGEGISYSKRVLSLSPFAIFAISSSIIAFCFEVNI
ncbi:MAG: hypothetical protein RBG13Loki_0100 [Promethearchaeota archaeon CR_4]|nr:MAG: hypothetical protein RBG13Loki_0100 [Candidatus Lokiarchaeota archaeon CR_4]